MRLRYVGLRPFKILVRDKAHLLHEGDVIDVDPWKIRSKRLAELFEPLMDDKEVLTEREKKLLRALKVNKRR